jgi:phasin family protein
MSLKFLVRRTISHLIPERAISISPLCSAAKLAAAKIWSPVGADDGLRASDRRTQMSQRPKTAAPARPTPAAKVAAKEVSAEPRPAKAPAAEIVARSAVDKVADAPAPVVEAPAPHVETPAEVVAAVAPAVTPPIPPETVPAAEVSAVTAAELINEISTTAVKTAEAIASAPATVTETTIPTPKPTFTRGMKSMMKTTEELVAFGQANMEAFVKSGQIWSAGMQDLTKHIASSAKASFDESVSTFKALSTVKSVKEAMDLQSTSAKSALEKMMAESNKLTDASIKLTEETLAPITARVSVAVETFKAP